MSAAIREYEMARMRLPISFALSLCAGTALFGLLHALTSVRAPIAVLTIPHVQFQPVTLAISAIPERPRMRLRDCEIREFFDAPLPPIPLIEFGATWIEMFDDRDRLELRFDPMEALRAGDVVF